MISEERIIVSLTSWYKRIGNVKTVVESLLNQTLPASKILINLCTEDFPNMEEDLPEDLLELVRNNSNVVEIYWFVENYKAWKKHLHALEIAEDNDLILSADDDHLYPSNHIENMYVSYCYYGKKFPVTLNKVMLVHNFWTFNGPGTLYRKSDWGNYKKYLTYDILHNCEEDVFINILFMLNNITVLPEIFHVPEDEKMLFNDVYAWTDKKAARRNNQPLDPIKELHKTTHSSIEQVLQDKYVKGRPMRLIPALWNIVDACAEYYKPQYNNLPYSLQWSLDRYYEFYLKANIYNIDYASIGLDVARSSSREDYIGTDNRLIITLSSWPGRISNVVPVINSILHNSILPTDIVVNLAKPDWNIPEDTIVDLDYLETFKNNDFAELIDLARKNPIIKLNWYNDSALKSWKKHLYVLDNYSENDVVICIDDDILYSEVFIETMLKSYNYYGREFPITSITSSYCQGMFAFCGHSTLYRPGDFKGYKEYITPEILHMFPEDNHLLNILHLNKKLLLPVIGRNYLFKDVNYNQGDSNFGNGVFNESWWKSYHEIMAESEKIILDKCSNRPELAADWHPVYFSFAFCNAKEFLEKYKDSWTEGYKKLIYDNIANHVKSGFGNVMKTGLELTLDNKII